MVNCESFRKLANAFPGIEEIPHFEKISFRINKKIFATLNGKQSQACVKLSENDQYVFSINDKSIIYPVPGKWGLQGWTMIELAHVNKKILKEILKSSYSEAAKIKNTKLIKDKA
ncbi:MAG: MmcQ/YjbR family DNA-binding protein [Bacteroidota bacterium]|nr:MmcQ/YjbR family DNA-binding protein [Bacteroidota bacterium]